MEKSISSRRKFLKLAGLAGAGLAVAGLAGCSEKTDGTVQSENTGHNAAAPAAGGALSWQEMDRMHVDGVKTFVAGAKGYDVPEMPFVLDGDVKVFDLVVEKGKWETTKGQSVDAYKVNGHVPGPTIRTTVGDKVRIRVTNKMTDESTAIHWHGLIQIPNKVDGVPGITQDPIKPGETYIYEFTVKNTGSHMYHSHHNSANQTNKGLLGAFIVEPKDKSTEPKADHDWVVILGDSGLGYVINGKQFPYTQPFICKKGETVRFRFMNEGNQIHPMHLHGFGMLVTHMDGYKLPQPFICDTLMIPPGNRYDAFVTADEPGVWAFHCHILTHAESEHGMFGMVTALIVQE